MKEEVREAAYAKLNLTLDVAEKRSDGYHEMLMVMQTVSLSDAIELKKTGEAGIRATCNFRYVPTDGRNLAVRAAELFCAKQGIQNQGIRIRMEKKIPVGAGMAGGSADAAAVLRGMNRLFGTDMSRKELEALAEEIGSDVAFCIAGGTSLAKGRGEILEDLDPMLRECAMRMYNVFEEVPDRRMRTVAEIKSTMRDFGALGAVMTGTGSAVFGVWQDRDAAENCAEELSREYRFCVVSRPTERLNIG